MQNKEELIERIIENIYTIKLKQIFKAILEEMELNKLFRIASKIKPIWSDQITYEWLCKQDIIEYVETKVEYYQGGSWTPEGNVEVEYWKCKFCDYKRDKSSVHSHLAFCKELNKLISECSSFEEFQLKLKDK